jgi:TonB family protein
LLVKGISFFNNQASTTRIRLLTLILTLTFSTGTFAQTVTPQTNAPSEIDQIQRRIARARSLAAVGRLAAAATELESLRSSSTDESVRDVSRVLLMWIYVEMPDYSRANGLLEETFKERTTAQNKDAATHAFYALAGQTINGVRVHLDRYRTFGLNVIDTDLPSEALADINQLRGLLERVVELARELRTEEEAKPTGAPKGLDTTALLEDAASVRLRLARTPQERARWQTEVSEARQRLVASETRIASLSSVALNQAPAANRVVAPAPAPTQDAAKGAQTKAFATTPARTKAPDTKTPADASAASLSTDRSDAPPASGIPAMTIGSLHVIARQKSSPSYPAVARTARIQGVVTVRLVINEKGEVESVLGAEGPQPLQGPASAAARKWKFHPTIVDGQPVRVTGFITFNFSL